MPMTMESTAGVTLARFGLTERDVERLVEALGRENGQTRRVVLGALRDLGLAAAPALHRGLASQDPTVRQEVISLLAAMERN